MLTGKTTVVDLRDQFKTIKPNANTRPEKDLAEHLALHPKLQQIFLDGPNPKTTLIPTKTQRFGLMFIRSGCIKPGESMYVELHFQTTQPAIGYLQSELPKLWQETSPRPHSVPERLVVTAILVLKVYFMLR